jgi:hypothetical protein
MLSVTNKPFMLSVINKPFMLSVVMLNIVMLSVFMLIVLAPWGCHISDGKDCLRHFCGKKFSNVNRPFKGECLMFNFEGFRFTKGGQRPYF